MARAPHTVKSLARIEDGVAGLHERLCDRIRREGPVRFRDWMEACLYDAQEGYYMRPGRKTGPGGDAGGDFATSPVLHPLLAHAVAAELLAVWRRIGAPEAFAVYEYGGGEGQLARDALAWMQQNAPDLARALAWHHIETSPHHRALQVEAAPSTSVASQLPDRLVGAVVAHEFVDALPVHVLERRKGNWAELLIDVDERGRFCEVLGIPRRRAVEAAPKRLVGEGRRVTSMVDARTWIGEVCRALEKGSLLVIDYGDRGNRLWIDERPDGTVRGFRDHQLVEDLYAHDAGQTDITASVDFTQLREWAMDGGLREGRFVTQEAFLVEHGALEALATAPRATLEEASAYLRLKQLVLPQGLGSAFKVQRLDA